MSADLVEIGVDGVRAPAAARDPRVVHEDVEAAEVLGDRGDAAHDALLVRDVQLPRGHVLAEVPGRPPRLARDRATRSRPGSSLRRAGGHPRPMPRFPPETSATLHAPSRPVHAWRGGPSAQASAGPRSRDRVELVRVVEDGGLCRPRGPGVVVRADGVQNLGEDAAVEPVGALLDQAQAEVDVAEELALGGREEERAAVELADAPDIVEKRGGEKQVRAQARVELRESRLRVATATVCSRRPPE